MRITARARAKPCKDRTGREELIGAALPPGCNLDCFFEKESWLKIEHTEEAVLDFFKEQNMQMPIHVCDCPDETVKTAAMAEAGS